MNKGHAPILLEFTTQWGCQITKPNVIQAQIPRRRALAEERLCHGALASRTSPWFNSNLRVVKHTQLVCSHDTVTCPKPPKVFPVPEFADTGLPSFLLDHSFVDFCIGFLGLPCQTTTNWVAENNRNLFYHSSRDQKSKVKVSMLLSSL